MKILMLTDRLALGGAETHLYELTRTLTRAGHKVTLAAEEGAFFERMRAEGYALQALPLASKHPLALARARHSLARLMQTGGFDLVHAHARLPAFLAAPLCRSLHLPFVTTAHWVFSARGWRGRMSEWGEHTFAVSEDIKDYLMREYGLPASRITVIENGIDTDAFAARRRTGEGRLLHVSRLDTGRAACAELLTECAARLAAGGACRSITIVGDGDRFEAIKANAEAANRQIGREFVRMVGGVTDVRPYLYEADLFVGVSRAALEAMATGLPTILAGDEGYLSLLTKENADCAMSGNLCCRKAPPISRDRLCADACAALARPDLPALGEWGAAFVREHYGIDKMAEATLRVYRKVATRRPPVTVCGYFGEQNTGDEAALLVLCRRLEEEGFSNICILGRRRQGGAFPIRGRGAILSRAAFPRGGIFLLGGGNLLQNETSDRSLFYYTRLLRRAKQAGMQTVVMGGIGRLDARGEERARRALEAADGFLPRTPRDRAAMERLSCGKKPCRLLTDGALWLAPKKNANFVLPKDKALIFAFRGERAVSEGTLAAVKEVLVQTGLIPFFAVMQAGRDEKGATRLAARCGGHVLPYLPPEELVGLMCGCRAVVGDRLHALILAAVAGTAAVGIADGGKIDAFCDLAAACGGGERIRSVPLTGDALSAAVGRAVALPRNDATLLRALREPWENFSFAEFFRLL